MCRTKDKDPAEDLEEEAVDNTADDAPRQNMIVLPVDPPYKSVLTNDTLLSVGHVYPREGSSKEIFLSRPQGESSLEIDGQVVTLESTLFPYLFPEGKGCYTPAEGSKKTSLTSVCGKKRPCKLGYPYDIYNGPTKYDEHRKEYLYKCPNYHSRNVVSYHPELMLAWNAHMCLKRVTHADFSYYLLKYTLKSEPTGPLSLNKEVESQMNMTNLDAGLVKVVNAMTQSQPVSEVGAALQMMRVPIVYMHIKYDNNVVDKSPVQFLMSTPPDLRKATVGMARGTITSHMDYYENRPDDTLINRMSYMEYHRHCYFPGKLLTSDRKQSKYVGTDMKGRHVYYRDHRKIVRIANYWPSNDPENFFYTVILSKVAFRLEGSLRNNDSETYYELCQLAGLLEPLDRVKQGHCSKLEAVLQEYYTDHFTKKYCIESTIDEILEYYDTRKHKTEVTAKVNASQVDQFNSKHLVIEGLPELNSDQAEVFSKLARENFVGLHVIKGPAGTGKYLGQEKKVNISPMTNYDDIYAIDPVAAKEMHSWYYDKKFHELAVIAVGCPVVSLTNKHYKGTYLTNGSIGVVQAIHYDSKSTAADNDEPVVKRIDVLMDGCTTAVPIYRTTNTTVHNGHTCKRKNFPLLLGKSMTIHKCQGSSMAGPVLLDFRDLFEVGMGYVLLTRKTSRDQLALTCCPTPEQLQVLSTYAPPSVYELRDEAKKEPKTKGNKQSHVHSQAEKLLAIDRSANTFMDKPHTRIEAGQQWLDPIPTTVTSIINANDWISNFANPACESTRDFLQHIPTASMKKLVGRKQALEMNTREWLYNEEIDFYAKYIKWRLEKNSSWCHILDTQSYLLIFRNNDPLEHILSAWKNVDSSAKFMCAFTAHDSHYSLLILGNFSSDSGSPYAFYLDSLPASMASVENRVSPSILGQFIDACPWRTSPLGAPVQIECLSVPQQKLSDGNCGPYVLLFFQRFLHMLSRLDSPPSQEILRQEILSWRSLHHSPAPYSEYAVALRHNYAKLLDQCALLQGS
ncbi:hypothetical protein M9434_001291 [Picochlorum sp. BPE23]|nr:hypothetical protein M9434_001291 [Picochlorum sp. BPE23]